MKMQTVQIDEVFWFQEGPGVRKWQFTNSGIKLLNVGNILTSGNLDLSKTQRCLSREEVEKRYKHFLVDEGDLVIASSGISFDDDRLLRTRGAFVQCSHLPLCLNTSTIRFKSKGDADLRYFRFWLDSHEFRSQITRLVTGSAQQNFGPSHLKEVQITLPTLSEQHRIAEQLEKANGLRRMRRYVLELSDTFALSVFLEMFGDPIRNPKGWERERFSDIGKLDRGKSQHRPRNAAHLYGGHYPFIQTGDIANCANYIKQHQQTYSEKGLKQSRLWPAGTLCITIAANIAKTGILTYPACFPDSVVGFLPNENVTTEFVQYWLSFLQVVLERTAPESAQKNINLEILRELPVPLPPSYLQKEFSDLVRRFEQLRTKEREAERQAEHLFQTLLHHAFQGESAVGN